MQNTQNNQIGLIDERNFNTYHQVQFEFSLCVVGMHSFPDYLNKEFKRKL